MGHQVWESKSKAQAEGKAKAKLWRSYLLGVLSGLVVLLATPVAQGAWPSPQAASSMVLSQTPPETPVKEPVLDVDARKSKAKFSFEFAKAEVTDVVKAISDMTRQNFIIPERIKGQRLTILSPTKITANEAYQVFYAALAANGISVVRSGKFYKLVDSKDAIKDTIPTCVGDGADCNLYSEQMVTILLPMRFIEAGQISQIIKNLQSKEGDVAVFAPSNSLIISEYAPNLRRIRKIIDALDVQGTDDDLQLVPVKYASASEMAEKLTQVFDIQTAGGPGGSRGRGRGPDSAAPPVLPGGSEAVDVQISKIIPDDRTNHIIIRANRRSFDAIRKLLAKLDVPISEGEQGRVHVHSLVNAKAEELASTLSALAQGQPASKGKAAAGMPGGPPGGSKGPEQASLFEGEVKITADKATNSLLVVSSVHDFRSLRSIIDKLDVARRQIYVEAAIMEINLKTDQSTGIDWVTPLLVRDNELPDFIRNLIPNSAGSKDIFGYLQSTRGASSGANPIWQLGVAPAAALTAAAGSITGLIGPKAPLFPGSELSVPSFGVMLKWLENTGNSNLLQTPHVITMDNESATIEVGEKIPFNRGLFGGMRSGGMGGLGGLGGMAGGAAGALGGGALGALGGLGGGLGALGGLGLGGLGGGLAGGGMVDRIDVSMKLTLTPQINERNKIRLEIDQSLEDVTTRNTEQLTPSTAHRSLKTVVVADDQQTIVLGGLVREKASETEIKTPILGDIPILGYFFKNRTVDTAKNSLMLVLTPYIVTGPADFQRIYERKLREHEEFTAQFYGPNKKFRSYIDYERKTGPTARLLATYQHESERLENGGRGDGTAQVIKPNEGAEQTKPEEEPAPIATVVSPPSVAAEPKPAAPEQAEGSAAASKPEPELPAETEQEDVP